MANLIDLEEAKAHLRVTTDTEDVDIEAKLEAATQVVIDYLSRAHDSGTWNAEMSAWTAETLPKSIRAAILVQLGDLYRNRGDDLDPRAQGASGLSPTVLALLMRYRDPGFA